MEKTIMSIAMALSIVLFSFNANFKNNLFNNNSSPTSSTPRIIIVGNTEMDTFASNLTGTGMAGHPYIIEDQTIHADGVLNSLFMQNVTRHLLIRNCSFIDSGPTYSGISLELCSNIVIKNCTITNNNRGIFLYGSTNCNISDCKIVDNGEDGVQLAYTSNNNLIQRNNISNNGGYGIHIGGSSFNNKITLNNIANNALLEAFVEGTATGNVWYVGILGNAWGNYTERYPSVMNDGVTWDTPYQIYGPGNGLDIYPLVDFQGVREPIEIDGDIQLAGLSEITGNGSEGNPYMIENFKISAGDIEQCIYIQNTRAHLIIRDGVVTNARNDVVSGAGIRIQNCTNVTIQRVRAEYNYKGLYIQNSEDCSILDNNITNNEGNGIHVQDHTKFTNFSGNNVSTNYMDGFFMKQSENNTINAMYCESNAINGIYLENSHENNISGNNLSTNGLHGISLLLSQDNEISNNNVLNNLANGIMLDQASNNSILGNNASNSYYGIEFEESLHNTLDNNLLWNCSYSIEGSIDEVTNHTIPDTNLVDNHPLYYYSNEISLIPDNFTGAGQIILANCSDATISNINIENKTDGILLWYSDNNTINNCNFSGNHDSGILLTTSDGNHIFNSTFSWNGYGISVIIDSNNTTIKNNNFTMDGAAIYENARGTFINASDNHMFGTGIKFMSGYTYLQTHQINTNNQVNGEILYYYVNKTNLGISNFTNAGQIFLVLCDNSTIANCDVSNTSIGVTLIETTNMNITNVDASHNRDWGIFISAESDSNNISSCNISYNEEQGLYVFGGKPDNNLIYNNTIIGNGAEGIFLLSLAKKTSQNNIIKNKVIGNKLGILVTNHGSSNISRNNCSFNDLHGIHIQNSDNNLIMENNVSFNNQNGILLNGSSGNNNIYLNRFWGNVLYEAFADTSGTGNTWDNSTDGNIWGNYQQIYPDATNNGAYWSIPYYINGSTSIYDNHPVYENLFPIADFISDAYTVSDGRMVILSGDTVQFTFTGLIGDWHPNITIFSWNFGSNLSNPTNTFNIAGNFTVSLTVTDYNMDIDIISVPISVLNGNYDTDKDGIKNDIEINTYGTNPLDKDTDGDGMPDNYEIKWSGVLDPVVDDGDGDPDGDGLENYLEHVYNTSPDDSDTDDDGFSDNDEVQWNSDPVNGLDTPVTRWILVPGIIVAAAIIAILTTIKVKKKKKYDELIQRVEQEQIAEKESEQEIIDDGSSFERKLTEKRSMLERVLEPKTASEAKATKPPITPWVTQKSVAKKIKKKPGKKGGEEPFKAREIDAKTEKEVSVELKEERCIVCESALKGTSYVCPSCGTKYCIRCAIALSDRKEPCWTCKEVLKF